MSELKCMAACDFEDLLQVQFVTSYVSVGLHYFLVCNSSFYGTFPQTPQLNYLQAVISSHTLAWLGKAADAY